MAGLDGPRFGAQPGQARQLVVVLHGLGADGQDLIQLAPDWAEALPEAAFIAPDAPGVTLTPTLGSLGVPEYAMRFDATPVDEQASLVEALVPLGGSWRSQIPR